MNISRFILKIRMRNKENGNIFAFISLLIANYFIENSSLTLLAAYFLLLMFFRKRA